MKTCQHNRQTVASIAKACLTAIIGMALCSSCSTPPSRDDGLVGLIYHASARPENGAGIVEKNKAERPVAPLVTAALGSSPTNSPVIPSGVQANYRISPGDVLAVSYFARPPGENKEYLVDSQDVLTISVAGQQTYTGDVTVRPDGCISFFLIGELGVRGMTVAQVRAEVTARIVKVMAGAEVTVILKAGNGLAQEFLNTLRSNTDMGSTRIVQIRHDGMVTFPLVGEINAIGKTMAGLSEEIDIKYDQVFRRGIAVALNLTSSSEGNIAILGEVRNPGRYTINNPISPFFALAMAGGALDTAKKSQVVVVSRAPGGKVGWHVINLDIDSGKPLGPDIALAPQDMLLVPKTGVANLNIFVDQYIRRMMPLTTGVGLNYNLN